MTQYITTLCIKYSQNVHSAAGAAALKGDADPGSCDDASNQAGRQSVFHQGDGRYGNHSHKKGLAYDTDQGPHKESSADRAVGQKEQRDIQQQINQTRNVYAAQIQMGIADQKGTDNLADSQHASIVQLCRHYKDIDSYGKDQHSCQCSQETRQITLFQSP